eukprot:2851145-Pleurochrysis_carterae.AAC.1
MRGACVGEGALLRVHLRGRLHPSLADVPPPRDGDNREEHEHAHTDGEADVERQQVRLARVVGLFPLDGARLAGRADVAARSVGWLVAGAADALALTLGHVLLAGDVGFKRRGGELPSQEELQDVRSRPCRRDAHELHAFLERDRRKGLVGCGGGRRPLNLDAPRFAAVVDARR